MSEKLIDLLEGVATPLTGVGPLIKLQSKEAADAPAPNTTKGTDKGDTPYRLAKLRLKNAAGTIAVYTVSRPNPRNAGVGAPGSAENAQEIGANGIDYEFDSKFPYAAFALHNWIVEISGYVCVYNAAPGPNIDPTAGDVEFNVVDNGGVLQVVIGDGTNIPAPGTRIAVINATPLKKTMLADGLNADVYRMKNPHDYVYVEGAAAEPSLAVLEPFYR